MGVGGLNYQAVFLPLAAGLSQKSDERALQPPGLSRALDVQFDETGGLQTRKPMLAIGSDTFTGGTMTAIRKVITNGDELLVFTQTGLYSWDAQLEKWVLKGSHLAIKVEEEAKFVTNGDQISADRAELDGVIVYAWEDTGVVYAAAVDKVTGAVRVAPYGVNSGVRPKLIALSTRILLFMGTASAELLVYSINPSSMAAGAIDVANTSVMASGFNSYYDVCRQGVADVAIVGVRRTVTTSYEIASVTAGLTVAKATVGRVCDGPIAVSVPSTGLTVQVLRGNTTNIQGDYITIASFVDVTTAQAVGTCSGTLNQIAACHRSVQNSSAYRCYAFWSSAESSGATDWSSKYNWVDTGGTIGTQATFVRRLGIASRAFDYNGSIYVWGAFAGESSFSGANPAIFRAQLQNTYFLYRDDITFHAKAASGRAGGFSPAIGHLPGVGLTESPTSFAWVGAERRIIPLGIKQSGYADRGPREIRFSFDSDEARRSVRLGKTLYITGGEILQYDGARLVELGFHISPWYFGAIEVGTGNITDGEYAYKVTQRSENARGELDRSTTATVGTVTIAGGPNGVSIVSWMPIYQTHKTGAGIAPAVEVWRTAVAPTADAPFFLTTSKDPAVTSNPQRFVVNDPTASTMVTFNDEYVDAVLTTKEPNSENGSVLENLAPPAASIIAASNDRLFLAGVAGDPDRVWYSKQRQDGTVASFHDALTIGIPHAGGAITALAFLNDMLVVFRETAIYVLPGDGYDNTANGQNYGPARIISADCGAVSMEAVALTPRGIIFKSLKGWYILSQAWAVEYIGAAISDYDTDDVVAVTVVESQHQIRVLTDSRMLVLDYLVNQWAEWTALGLGATIWNGTYHYINDDEILAEQSTLTDLEYGWDVETAWIPMATIQGAGRLRFFEVLGEYISTFHLRVRIAYDYQYASAGVPLYVDDEYWTPSPTTVGSALQVQHWPAQGRCQAFKIRLTAVSATNHAQPPTGGAAKLTGLSFELGFDKGINRRLPVAQRQ